MSGFKYIARIRKNGRWRYIYKDSKSEGSGPRTKNSRDANDGIRDQKAELYGRIDLERRPDGGYGYAKKNRSKSALDSVTGHRRSKAKAHYHKYR